MTPSSVCFVALPGAWPGDWPEEEARSGVSPCRAAVTVAIDGRAEVAERAVRLAPRLAPSLLGEAAASEADTAAVEAGLVVLLLPVGRYDDAVWSPILERLIRRRAAAPGAVLVAWSGLEPFLAAYGGDADALRETPHLAPAVLAAVGRSAPALGDVVAEAGLRRAVALFDAQPDRPSIRFAVG